MVRKSGTYGSKWPKKKVKGLFRMCFLWLTSKPALIPAGVSLSGPDDDQAVVLGEDVFRRCCHPTGLAVDVVVVPLRRLPLAVTSAQLAGQVKAGAKHGRHS